MDPHRHEHYLLFIERICSQPGLPVCSACWFCGGLLYQHLAAATNDPWKSPQLLALKRKIGRRAEKRITATRDSPTRLGISPEIPASTRFGQNRRLAVAGWRGGVGAGGQQAAGLRKPLPLPQPRTDADKHAIKLAARARWSLAGVGLVVAGSLLIIRLGNSSVLPGQPGSLAKTP